MRKIGTTKVLDDEFSCILEAYSNFFNDNKECSSRCPFGLDWTEHGPPNSKLTDLYHTLTARGQCFCGMFAEFYYDRIGKCPCGAFGEEAFVRLETVIGKLQDPEEYRI